MRKLIILIVSIIIVFSACKLGSPYDYEVITPDMGSGGALFINVDSDNNFRSVSIDPKVLTIDSYTVTGTHSNGMNTFTFDVTSNGAYLKAGLLAGVWSVTVDAFDSTPKIIATDTVTDIDVVDNETSPVPITVVPVSGAGTLTLNLFWSVSDVETADFSTTPPSLEGLSDFTPTVINIDNGAGTAQCTASPDAGYYILSITLEDSAGTFMRTITTAVRILNGEETTGSIYFDDDPGGMSIDISADLQNPFNLSFTKTQDLTNLSISNLDTMNVSVSPDSGSGVNYRWFLNGAEITVVVTNNNLDINSNIYPLGGGTYPIGFYTLTSIVTLTDGAMCSDDVTFTIDP